MFTRLCLSLALLLPIPAWSQVPFAAGGGDRMTTPPPVSGEALPTEVGAEAKSNYVRGGFTFTPAYGNDVEGEIGATAVNDFSYSFFPSIEIDKVTPRMHLTMTYSPSLTIYQRTSAANQSGQGVMMNFQYRLSPHVAVMLEDGFQKTGNVFNQQDALSGPPVSGSPTPPLTGAVDLIADLLANQANAQLTYQYRRNEMVGVGGTYTNLDYLQPTEALGLYNSNTSGGQAFYSHRMARRHYLGATYQYSKTLAYPPNSVTALQSDSYLLFYTVFLKPTLSLSFSGGPQLYKISQFALPTYSSSSPALTANLGWQGLHTNFVASYARAVTSGSGLAGVFQSNSAYASARWKVARTWSLQAVASYTINKDISPSYFPTSSGGHRTLGAVWAQHQLSEHFAVEFRYTNLQQQYSGIPALRNASNVSRGSVSLSYNFSRPLGG
jgi:hypothetical protein